MLDIEKLVRIAPPPASPKGAGMTEQWEHLETEFNLKFPAAYKELIAIYGAGRFTNFFGVVNPFYTSPHNISFREFVRLRTRDMADAKVSYPQTAVSLSVYPEAGGLFPWGYTDNGDTICWLTEGDSSRWPVICLELGYLNTYDRFKMTIIEFIEKWLANRISVPTLTPPDFYPLHKPVFSPDLLGFGIFSTAVP